MSLADDPAFIETQVEHTTPQRLTQSLNLDLRMTLIANLGRVAYEVEG